jgi:hypothetical protein
MMAQAKGFSHSRSADKSVYLPWLVGKISGGSRAGSTRLAGALVMVGRMEPLEGCAVIEIGTAIS